MIVVGWDLDYIFNGLPWVIMGGRNRRRGQRQEYLLGGYYQVQRRGNGVLTDVSVAKGKMAANYMYQGWGGVRGKGEEKEGIGVFPDLDRPCCC